MVSNIYIPCIKERLGNKITYNQMNIREHYSYKE